MATRGTSWSVTINNPTPADEEAINIARQKGWKVDGQKEKGKEGTLHYQLMVRTPQVRFSAVKKQFPRAHIELARNSAALATYVSKEETRVSALPAQQEKYPSLSKFWDLVYDKLSEAISGPPEDMYEWKKYSDRKKLDLLDAACEELISDGYHIETMAVNPQTRASFAKFAQAILFRSYADRQTRQTNCVQNTQEVSLPIINDREEQFSTDDDGEGDEEETAAGEGESGDDYEESETCSDEGCSEGSSDNDSESSSQSEE